MVTWALQHPYLTAFLVFVALRVLWVWGQAVRRQERIVKVEPPPPLQSTVTVEQVCPRCRAREQEGPLDRTLREIQEGVVRVERVERVCPRCWTKADEDGARSEINASLDRTEAIIKRWDKGN